MKRSPIALVVLASLLVASTATAYLLINKPSPVVLPSSAFTDKTLMAVVVDLEQADGQTKQTIKDTIADVANSVSELFGQQEVPEAELTEVYQTIDRLFGALSDQQIQAIGYTMEMDVNEMIRNSDEGVMPEPVMTLLVKAGKEPDLVALITGVAGEEMPVEVAQGMAQSITFHALADGWYAIDPGLPVQTLRIPSGQGDAEVAAKFNQAMTHSSGGLLQAGVVIPEDAANALSGKMAAEMPQEAPEAMREMMRSFSDMKSISYALDLDDGLGIRCYVVFDNADTAKRMLDAYTEMLSDLPALFEAANAISPVPEEDKEMVMAIQAKMQEMMKLVEISRENETIKFAMQGENFMEMIEMMSEIMPEMIQAQESEF